jgi:anti-anti-sigma factor
MPTIDQYETWPLCQVRNSNGVVLAEAECAELPGEQGREWFVKLRGDLDAFTVPELRDALAANIDGGQVFQIEMSEVTFMSASGVGLVVDAHQVVQAHGGRVRILDPSPCVRRLLEIVGTDTLVELQDAPG